MGKYLFFILALGLLFAACSGSKTTTKPEATPKNKAIAGLENLNEDFDPLTLNEPPIPIIAKNNNAKKTSGSEADGAPEAAAVASEIIGYRIQIFQTESAQEARNVQQDAFLRLDIDAYVSYDNPYYKVRIGDFTSRYDAEEFLDSLEGRGYKSAWIVRTLIVNPASKSAEKQDGLN